LRLRELTVERMTVVKLGVNDRGSNGTSTRGIKVRPDTAKLTNVIVTGFGEKCNLVREGKMFVKDKAKVLSKVGRAGLRQKQEGPFPRAQHLLGSAQKHSIALRKRSCCRTRRLLSSSFSPCGMHVPRALFCLS